MFKPLAILKPMFAAALLLGALPAAAMPPAIFTDPPHDAAHPARLEVLHIPSGVVEIDGVAYLAAGAGPHPTLVICHGWPGNEKNLDLAQAVRRAGWNAVTFNYRGSWGSPGAFRFAHNPEDAAALLAYLRAPANAAKLGVDPARIAIAGHSMGGWVAALSGARDPKISGVALFSMADMGNIGRMPRAEIVKLSAGNAETLAQTSPEQMADELTANSLAFTVGQAAAGLATRPLLVLTADDGLAGDAERLVAEVRAAGGTQITTQHVATDHSWNGSRIALESALIDWLATLR